MKHAHHAHTLFLCAGLSLGLASCANPFASDDSDFAERLTPAERLRHVEHFVPLDRGRKVDLQYPLDPVKQVGRRMQNAATISLPIEQCRAAALENNLDLKVALVDPTIASERVNEEAAKFEAVFVPRLDIRNNDEPTLDSTASNSSKSISGSAGVSVPMRTGGRATVNLSEGWNKSDNPFLTLDESVNSDLQFSISHPLLRNAGRRVNTYSIRIAGYDEQAAEARTKLEVIRQLAAADRSYWRLYASKEALKVTQTQLELAQALLDKARRRFNAGDVAEVEVVRAESGVASRLEAIINAENAVLTQQRELKGIINLPELQIETTTVIETATAPDPVFYLFDGLALADLAVGEGGRMEMLELELQLAADAATIEFNRNQALPLLSLDYTYKLGGLDDTFIGSNRVLANNKFESWFLGLSGEIPIGNEAALSRVRRSILSRVQRLSTKDARRQSIRQEVLDAVDTVTATWQRILAAQLSTRAAERTYKAEQRQNDVGLRTATDVLDAASRLGEAQLSEIRALAEYQIALVDLAFATGTLLGSGKVEFDARPFPESERHLASPDWPLIPDRRPDPEVQPAPPEGAPPPAPENPPAPGTKPESR